VLIIGHLGNAEMQGEIFKSPMGHPESDQ
jgi:hypothetical protein